MTTEQYSIGYEEGHQAGWNAAMESLLPQRQPLTDEQIDEIFMQVVDAFEAGKIDYESHGLARAIEAAHGIGDKT